MNTKNENTIGARMGLRPLSESKEVSRGQRQWAESGGKWARCNVVLVANEAFSWLLGHEGDSSMWVDVDISVHRHSGRPVFSCNS